ncbi:hypothetical protein HAV21_21980 [Paenarthrobacter sp. MSM-2-10-13]|jgi:hypothetical protein|uniref:hypothetical protein n=1 Tax=Paenarthrobacter sp. MSM-2-10-13 TaxID=2717318 RepID=UPI001420B472|nr:hypothetical protein [Paenarthrobacter sp. MSM-2-10-13]NHW49528.1 hypothetical protein [Paenarthrobacter sp. MSM-2-10-13]
MTAVSKKTVTVADTQETIDGLTVLGDYHMNGGYDWMELIEEHGWAVLSSWGSDGWDLGQWPYVMVAVTRTADSIGNLFGIATYCEGDVTCTYYRTKARLWDAITEQAFSSWKNGQAQGPADLPEAAAELPSRYRMPYAVQDAA